MGKSLLLGRGLTVRDFTEIRSELNGWGWDERLGPKPDGYDELGQEEKYDLLKPFMAELSILTSEYEWLRYCDCEKEEGQFRMTPEEFDRFFDENTIQPLVYGNYERTYRGKERKDGNNKNRGIPTVTLAISAAGLLVILYVFLTELCQ